ncbi:MAG TPA: universal stress protein [Gemmatimonadaceae bacterium]|nr:universal stress protein [Gemmatimonadaceae bacterium]
MTKHTDILEAEPVVTHNLGALATLVATDGNEPGCAATRIAAALMDAARIVPSAIVVDPTPLPTGEALAKRRSELDQMLESTGASGWSLRVRAGDPVEEIAREAKRGAFELLMIGLRQHGWLERATRRETALRIIARSEIPVLGVAYWLHRVPRRIVVGIDFSRSSIHAAEMACRILADRGRLVLAHGDQSFASADEDMEGATRIYEHGVEAKLTALMRRLPLPLRGTIETVPLRGAPAPALLELAERSDTDVLAVGRQHHRPLSRWLLGSVTADLVRDARCSVLVTPLLP